MQPAPRGSNRAILTPCCGATRGGGTGRDDPGWRGSTPKEALDSCGLHYESPGAEAAASPTSCCSHPEEHFQVGGIKESIRVKNNLAKRCDFFQLGPFLGRCSWQQNASLPRGWRARLKLLTRNASQPQRNGTGQKCLEKAPFSGFLMPPCRTALLTDTAWGSKGLLKITILVKSRNVKRDGEVCKVEALRGRVLHHQCTRNKRQRCSKTQTKPYCPT